MNRKLLLLIILFLQTISLFAQDEKLGNVSQLINKHAEQKANQALKTKAGTEIETYSKKDFTIKDKYSRKRADTEFEQRKTFKIKGNLTYIGSNILNPDSGGSQGANLNYNGDESNGNLDMQYADLDDYSVYGISDKDDTKSSSFAKLNLGECSEVLYAGLYWAGTYAGDEYKTKRKKIGWSWYTVFDGYTSKTGDPSKIKFRTPWDNTYRDIEADDQIYDAPVLIDDNLSSDYYAQPYVYYKDVTDIVTSYSKPNSSGLGGRPEKSNGRYFAGNILATVGNDPGPLGGSAGWVMVVVYKDQSETQKYISVYDGFTYIASGGETQVVSYNDFKTIPTGVVNGNMLVAALEGDKSIQGDAFSVEDVNSPGDFITLKGGKNPENNFFNGSFTKYDQYYNDRDPFGKNAFFDVDLFSLRKNGASLLKNDQTSLKAKFTTTGDSYWAFLNALAIDIIEPNIEIVKSIKDIDGNDITGGNVTLGVEMYYELEFQNKGNDDATETIITDLLPKNVLFEDLILPAGVTKQSYEAPSEDNGWRGLVTLKVEDRLVIKNGSKHKIRIKVKVQPDCTQLKNVCSNKIENQAAVSCKGIEGGVFIDEQLSYAGIDECGNGTELPSQVLVDFEDCPSNSQICGAGKITLEAGSGFESYQWYDDAGNAIPGATGQTLEVDGPGVYKVEKKVSEDDENNGCKTLQETITVTPFNDGKNPLDGSIVDTAVDIKQNCSTSNMIWFYLCGDKASKTIKVDADVSKAKLIWQKLKPSCDKTDPDSSVYDAGYDPVCPETEGACWQDLGLNPDTNQQEFSERGQYRLLMKEDGCFDYYYFTIFKGNLKPKVTEVNMYCGKPGKLIVTGLTETEDYGYVLKKKTGTPSDNDAPENSAFNTGVDANEFEISEAGEYRIWVWSETTKCKTYVDGTIKDVQLKDTDVVVTPEKILCGSGENSKAKLRININSDIRPDFKYVITRDGETSPVAEYTGIDNPKTFEVSKGTYTVTVSSLTDSLCTVTKEKIDIRIPKPLELQAVVTNNINCNDGLITLNTVGGTQTLSGEYSYAIWSYTPASGATASPISYSNIEDIPIDQFFTASTYTVEDGAEGKYVFAVVDANDCNDLSEEVEVIKEPALVFDAKPSPATCGGKGKIEVTVPAEASGYAVEYALGDEDTPGAYQASPVFNDVEPDEYYIHIVAKKSKNTCNLKIGPFKVEKPTALTDGSASASPIHKCGETPTITFTPPTTGTPPYKYSIGGPYQDSPIFTGLSENTSYNVSIKDKGGCENVLRPITIKALPKAEFEHKLSYDCKGEGTVTITEINKDTSNPAGPFKYELDGNGSPQDSNEFSGLAQGAHEVVVTGDRMCPVTVKFTVLDKKFNAIFVESKPVTCNGGNDGTITVQLFNLEGGKFEYQINGGVWQDATASSGTYLFDNLEAGDYEINIRPEDTTDTSCVVTIPKQNITQPTKVEITEVNVQPIKCNPNKNGEVTVKATGGAGTYTYQLYDNALGTGVPVKTALPFTDLAEGTYYIIARDKNGCPSEAKEVIIAPRNLPIHKVAQLDCYTGTNGQIEVTAESFTTGGKVQYGYRKDSGSWVWSSETTDATYTITPLTPGKYEVKVKDVTTGCESTVSNHEIFKPLTATIDVPPLTCNGVTITVTANGGDGNYVYAFISEGATLQDSDFSSTNTFSTTTPRKYTVYVRDHNGVNDATAKYCEFSEEKTIEEIKNPEVAVETTPADCNGSETGSFKVTITEGKADYKITVAGGPTVVAEKTVTSITTPISYENLKAGIYTVTVEDTNGCKSTSVQAVVGQPDNPLSATVENVSDYVCTDGTKVSAKIKINAQGGTPNYKYKVQKTGAAAASFQDSNEFELAEGEYTITVEDSKGCNIEVTEKVKIKPLPIMPEFEQAATPNCKGEVTVKLTPKSGTGKNVSEISYQYSLDGAAITTSDTFGPLSVGAHTVVVSDANGRACEVEVKINVGPGQEFKVKKGAETATTCFEGADGTVTINVFNGVNFQYDLGKGDGWQDATATLANPTDTFGSYKIENLKAGSYTVKIQPQGNSDAACIETINVTITEPTEVKVTKAGITKDITCIPATGASIKPEAEGGAGNYKFELFTTADASGTPIQTIATGEEFTDVPTGIYYVVATDGAIPSGCKSEPYKVEINDKEAVTHEVADIECFDGTNGKIKVTALTGAGDYQFGYQKVGDVWKWETPTPTTATTHELSPLQPGTYKIKVKDKNGCESPESTHTIYPVLKAEHKATPVTCGNGSVEITAEGGDGNYVYAVVKSTVTPVPDSAFGTNNTINIIDSGDYIILVRDHGGAAGFCEFKSSTPINIGKIENAEIEVASKQGVGCKGDSTGLFTINISKGKAPFKVTVSGGKFTTPDVKTNVQLSDNPISYEGLTQGTYTVKVEDDNGCSAIEKTVEIKEPENGLSATASLTTDYRCIDGKPTAGIITVVPSGGTAPYKYSIGGSFQSEATFEVSQGNYTITVEDKEGCKFEVPTEVKVKPLPIMPDFEQDLQTNCKGEATVTLNVKTGTGTNVSEISYQYSLDGGAVTTSNVFGPLSVGAHKVVVSDVNGRACDKEVTINVAPGQEFKATLSGTTQTTCFEGNDGKVTINIFNGKNFQYDLGKGAGWQDAVAILADPADTDGTYVIENLEAGNYSIKVQPQGNKEAACIITISAEVKQPTEVKVTKTKEIQAITCNPDKGATIQVEAEGGAGSYTFELFSTLAAAEAGTGAIKTGSPFTDVPVGIYYVVAKDVSGCPSKPKKVEVKANEAVTHEVADIECFDGKNGVIKVTALTGSGGYQFGLLPEGSVTWQWRTPGADTYEFASLSAGKYKVKVKDVNNCESPESEHEIFPVLKATYVITKPTCNDGSVKITAEGGKAPYQYSVVKDGQSPVYGTSDTVTIPSDQPGDYKIYVKDAAGCTFESATPFNVEKIENTEITVASKTNVGCNADTTGEFTIILSKGKAPYKIVVSKYMDPMTIEKEDIELSDNPIKFENLAAGLYYIDVTDDNGCTSVQKRVKLEQPANPLSVEKPTLTSDYECINGVPTKAKVTIIATGGATPYQYSVNGGVYQASNVFELADGVDYVFTVKDDNGCEADTSANMLTIDPLPEIPDFTESQVANCKGEVTLTLTPPATPTLAYTYAIKKQGEASFTTNASNVFDDLPVGTHTIKISAPRACDKEIFVAVAPGQEFDAKIEATTNPTCNGASDGTITIKAFNYGNVKFEYKLNGAAWQTAATTNGVFVIENLADGTYKVEMRPFEETDTACIIESTETLTEPSKVTVTASITKEITCSDPKDAVIEVRGANGTGSTYTYELYDTDPTSSPAPSPVQTVTTPVAISSFVVTSAGEYWVIAKDVNGCPSDAFQLPDGGVKAPEEIVFTATEDNICYDGTNGSITVTVTSDHEDLLFILNNGAPQTPDTATPKKYTFDNLGVGEYTIKVKDGKGCEKELTTPINIYPELTASAVVTDAASCKDGEIKVTIKGGKGDYTYDVSGPSINTTANAVTGSEAIITVPYTYITGTSASYTITVKDEQGTSEECTVTLNEDVEKIDELTNLVVTPNTPVCFGEKGSAEVKWKGGSAPYTLEVITGGSTVQTITTSNVDTSGEITESITGLDATKTYTVKVTDANGCDIKTNISLTTLPELEATIGSLQPTTCAPFADAPTEYGFTYEIPASSVPGAPYTLQVRDKDGNWDDVTITGVPPYIVEYRNIPPGTPVYPAIRIVKVDTTVPPTYIEVCVKYLDLIETKFPVEGLVVTPIAVPGSCKSGVSITVKAEQGTGPYQFSMDSPTGPWTDADECSTGIGTCGTVTDPRTSTSVTNFDQYTYPGLTPGIRYDFYVKDLATGCIRKNNKDYYADDFKFKVPITATIGAQDCEGATDTGEITFTIDNSPKEVSAGVFTTYLTDDFEYTIYKRDLITNVASEYSTATTGVSATMGGSDTKDITISNLPEGKYYIVVKGGTATSDPNDDCTFGLSEADVRIEQLEEIKGTPVKINDISCSVNGKIEVRNISGGVAPYTLTAKATYSKTGGGTGTITIPGTGNTIEIPYADLIDVDATQQVIVEITVEDSNPENKCTKVLPDTVKLDVTKSPTLTVDTAPTTNCTSSNKKATVTVVGGKAPYQYAIKKTTDAGAYVYSSETTSTTFEFENLDVDVNAETAYTVIVRDANGCTSEVIDPSKLVKVYPTLDFVATVKENLKCTPKEATIEIKVTSGTELTTAGDFSYTITAAGGNASVATTSGTITGTNVTADHKVSGDGTYNVTVTDNKSGCVTTVKTVTVNPGEKPVFTAEALVETICNGTTDGKIRVTPTDNGLLPLNYTINPTPSDGSSSTLSGSGVLTFEGLAGSEAGIEYTITAVGNNGCRDTQTVTIKQNKRIDISNDVTVDPNPFKCTKGNNANGATITFTPDASEGTGPFTVSFVYDNNTPANTSDDITQPASTNYTFVVANTAGGKVTVTATDSLGCTDTHKVTVPAFNALSNGAVAKGNAAICGTGASFGVTFDSSVTGTPINAEVTVSNADSSVNEVKTGTSPVSFTDIPSGSYTIVIKNTLTGCELTIAHTVDPIAKPKLVLTKNNDVACNGTSTGSVTIDFVDPKYIGPYTYSLKNEDGTPGPILGTTSSTGGATTINDIPASTTQKYYIEVVMTANPLCTIQSELFEIKEPTNGALVPAGTPTAPNCKDGTNGTIDASTTSGGWGGYQYKLVDALGNPAGGSTAYSSDYTFDGLTGGVTYTLWVKDNGGCEEKVDITIPNPTAVEITAIDLNDDSCTLKSGGEIKVTATGGSGTYTYVVKNTTTSIVTSNSTGVFSDLPAGGYEVSATDTKGCPAAIVGGLNSTVTLSPKLDFNLTLRDKLKCGTDGVVEIKVVSGSGTYEYEVTKPGATVVGRTTLSGTVTFNASTAEEYTVKLWDTGAKTGNPPTAACEVEKKITVDPAIKPEFTAKALSNVVCDGATDGIIRMTPVKNGVTIVGYSILPDPNSVGQITGNEFTNLSAALAPGTEYIITAHADNGCTSTQKVILTKNKPINISSGVVDVKGFECTTGNTPNVASVIVNGGNTTTTEGSGEFVRVKFVFTPAGGGAQVTQESAGLEFYTNDTNGGSVDVTVFDSEGCSAETTVSIPELNALSNPKINIDKEVFCSGGATLSVTWDSSITAINADVKLIASNGIEVEEKLSSPSGVQFTGVAADTYTVEIKNPATGCIVKTYETINPAKEYQLTLTKNNDVQCFNEANGSVTFNFAAAPPFSGTYNYVIKDDNGTPNNFADDNPSSVAGNSVSGEQTVANIPVSTSGTKYYVEATMIGDPGCLARSIFFEIKNPENGDLIPAGVATAPSCKDGTNGSIDASTTSGGWGGYKYKLQDSASNVAGGSPADGSFDSDYIFEGLTGGETYTLFVEDTNGCIKSTTVTVPNPTQVEITSIVENDDACTETTGGTITVTATGGTGSFTYQVKETTSGSIVSNTTGEFTLGSGTYEVSATDTKGCQAILASGVTSTVTLSPKLSFGLDDTVKLTCNNPAKIEVEITKGSGSYDYEVKLDGGTYTGGARKPVPGVAGANGAVTFEFNATSAGEYTVTVWDTSATPECSVTQTKVIEPAVKPVFTAKALVETICNSATDGIIRMTPTNNAASPLTYTISPDPNSTGSISTNEFTGLPVGSYTITATGANGCIKTAPVVIKENKPINVSDNVTVTSFECTTGNQPNSAVVTVTPDTSEGSGTFNRVKFVYTSNDPSIAQQTQESASMTYVVTDTNGGTVEIILYDSLGCASNVHTETIQPLNVLAITKVEETQEVNCTTGASILVEWSSSISGSPISAEVRLIGTDSANNLTLTGTSSVNFTGVNADSYMVEVENTATGCIDKEEIIIDSVEPYTLIATKTSDVTCFGTNTGEAKIEFSTSTPYTGNYDYKVWKDLGVLGDTSDDTATTIAGTGVSGAITIGSLDASTDPYYVVIKMTDNPYCPITSNTFVIKTTPGGKLDVTGTPKATTCVGNSDGIVVATATGGWKGYKFKLLDSSNNPVGGNTDYDVDNEFEGLSAGTYELYVIDINGCEVHKPVKVDDPTPVEITAVTADSKACDSTTGGVITITATGGTGSYNFQLLETGTTNVKAENTTGEFTNLPQGNFTINVIDQNSCPATAQAGVLTDVVITPFLDFSLEPTKKIDCSSTPAGEVTITVDSGSGKYEYTVAGPSPITTPVTIVGGKATFSTPITGTYEVTVTDTEANCSIKKEIGVDDKLEPEFTVEAVDSTIVCYGESDGEIKVIPADNGLLPLTYTISPSGTWDPTTKTFKGIEGSLAGIEYTITATGTNGCTSVQKITFTENPQINLTQADFDVKGFGCLNGNDLSSAIVTFKPTATVGGSGTFENIYFVYDNNTPADTTDDSEQNGRDMSFVVSNTKGGTVTVTVTDTNGCEQTIPIDIPSLNMIENTAVTQTQDVFCGYETDPNRAGIVEVTFDSSISSIAGTIKLIGSTVTYTLTDQTSPAVFTGVEPDNYVVEITNTTTGCIDNSLQIDVKAPEKLKLLLEKESDITCLGTESGIVTFEFEKQSDGTPLYAGPYNYVVMADTNGTPNDYTDDTPVTGTSLSLSGSSLGGATKIEKIPATPAGTTYYVKAEMSDPSYCDAVSAHFTIEAPISPLTLSYDLTLISCLSLDDSGAVKMTATGGWGDYQYKVESLDGGTTVLQDFDENNIYTGLGEGNYQITVRDVNGCETTPQIFKLELPKPITATTNIKSNDCEGYSLGEIEVVNVAGGQGNPAKYTYSLIYPNGDISTPQASNTFTNLVAEDYEVIVYDEYGCREQFPVTIGEPAKVVAKATVNGEITCKVTTVSVDVTATGGTAPYQYSQDKTNWSAGPFSVGPGPHQFYAKDSKGCVSEADIITVKDVDPLKVELETEDAFVTCNGDANAQFIVLYEGGLGNYQFELIDEATNTTVAGPQADPIFTGIGAGTYHVKVTSGDCEAITLSHTIKDVDPIEFDVDKTDIQCFGIANPTGSITIKDVKGGNGNYTYSISSEPGKFQIDPTFDQLEAGVYTVVVTDEKGCYEEKEVEIEQPEEIKISLVGTPTVQTCASDPKPTFKVKVEGGVAPYQVRLNDLTPVTLTAAGELEFTVDSGEDYFVIVEDAAGCQQVLRTPISIPAAVDITEVPSVKYLCEGGAEITALVAEEHKDDVVFTLYDSADSIVDSNDTGVFNVTDTGLFYIEIEHVNGCKAKKEVNIKVVEELTMEVKTTVDPVTFNDMFVITAQGGVAPYEYSIDGGDYVSTSVPYQITETKEYSIVVRDSRGCIVSETVKGSFNTIQIPNYFTPNGDGKNDYWYPYNVKPYNELEVEIYDRYRRRIAIYSGYQEQGWNGEYEGTPLPTGDYWYIIRYKEISGEQKNLMGHFTLYRKH